MAQFKQLQIVSYNMHGFNQGRAVVEDLITGSHPDVILLQEHWLTPANLNKFDQCFDNYFTFGCSAMANAVEAGIIKGRPFGGVISMISNDLRKYTVTIACSDRYTIIKVYNTIIINLYMPCIGTSDRLLISEDIIADIWSWREKFPMCECIIAGDFNTNLESIDIIAKNVNEFANKNNLLRCDKLFGKTHVATYINDSLHHQSTIDYVLTTSRACVIDFDILDPDINFSDHLPIILTCVCSADIPDESNCVTGLSTDAQTYYRWDRADLVSYYNYTGQWLQPVLKQIEEIEDDVNIDRVALSSAIEIIYEKVVSTLNSAATSFVPKHKKSFYKFWWDEELNSLKEDSIDSNKLWKAAGKPRQGPIFDRRQLCRLRYRKQIRDGEKLTQSSYTNDLHDSLIHKNGPEFWKCWRSKFEFGNKCDEVDGCVDEKVIVDKLADHFSKSYTCNSVQRAAALQAEYNEKRIQYAGLSFIHEYSFDVELVGSVLTKLKCGKAAGLDGLSAEHLTNSHPILSCIMYRLFNLIMGCGHVPSAFGRSYTVPIPKLSDCRTKSMSVDDFRGIAISPVISKVFEHCILDRFKLFFTTVDNQFGFKKGLSCSHAIYTVRNLVDRFISGGSTVNICALDLSKAFDKVNHYALFLKLMNRNIPCNLLCILEDWFNKCLTCVKWKSTYSAHFKIVFGVRQGSVLSPHLFAIYINDIASGLGFSQRAFIVLYADDILLVAPSLTELQSLFKMCELELAWLDICINTKKSCCTRIGSRFDINCIQITSIDGMSLPWVTELRYLGVYIISSRKFKCSLDYAKRAFYRAANAIFGKVSRVASEEVVLQLIKSKCYPVLLYGLEAIVLNNVEKNSIDFTAKRFFMKLFRTVNSEIITDCQTYFGIDLPSVRLSKLTVQFIARYNTTDNYICNLFK